VHCDTSDEVARAKDLLKNTGAQDIASSKESGSATSTTRTASTTSYDRDNL
jgi:hypothetical protein